MRKKFAKFNYTDSLTCPVNSTRKCKITTNASFHKSLGLSMTVQGTRQNYHFFIKKTTIFFGNSRKKRIFATNGIRIIDINGIRIIDIICMIHLFKRQKI